MHQPVCVTHTLEMMTEATVTSTRTACFRTAYDDLGRVTGETLSVNGGAPITLGANTYDGIGRLQRQTLGSQNVDYEYDIQSHLTSIGSGIYRETAQYAVDSPTGSTSYIYVNATRDAWGHGAPSQPERNIEWRYRYDGLGRLTEARSADGKMAEITDMDLDAKVRGVTRRYLNSNVQDVVISYDGALPTSVRDVSTPYYVEAVGRFSAGDYAMAHDALGRLTADGTRGVQAVTYVPWGNLPKHITMDNGDYTDNTYLPDGTLMNRIFNTKRIVTVTTVNAKGDTIVRQRRQDVRTTHKYYGPWEVTTGAENRTRLHTACGYYDYATGAHRWYLRNRQGSVMAVVDGAGNVLQRSGVYPGGTPFSVDYNAEATRSLTAATDRLHIGNSWMSHSGLNWYDNTARMHDPLLMRFTTPDALATDYPSLSPWTHCAGNPANLTDPDGMDFYLLLPDGSFALTKETTDAFDVIIGIGESIMIDKGFMSGEKTVAVSNQGNNYEEKLYFSNDNMDEEFKFFVRNSNVEWSRLKFSDGSSVLGTLGEEGFDGTLGYFIKAKPDRLKQLTQFDHCHPNGRTMPSDADIDIVIDAQKISLNSIECKIYNSANTDEYMEFDSQTPKGQIETFPEFICPINR